MRLVLPSVLLFLVASLAACDTNKLDDPESVLVRVENTSSITFSSVLVRFPGTEERFESLDPGQASEYREVETAFRYGYIKVETYSETFQYVPIDYVGEEPLENGRYTYELDLTGSRLSLEFKRD